MRERGRVRWISFERGFGFLAREGCALDGKGLYFRCAEIAPAGTTVAHGDWVEFFVARATGRYSDRWEARNVTKTSPPDSSLESARRNSGETS